MLQSWRHPPAVKPDVVRECATDFDPVLIATAFKTYLRTDNVRIAVHRHSRT